MISLILNILGLVGLFIVIRQLKALQSKLDTLVVPKEEENAKD